MELLSSAAPAIFDTACLELWGRWGFKGLGGTICLCRLTQQSFKGTCCCFFWNLLLVCCCLLLVWDKEALGGGSRGRRSFLSKCLHSCVGWQSMDQLVFDDDDDDQECGASVSPPPRSTGEPSDKNWFLLFAELSHQPRPAPHPRPPSRWPPHQNQHHHQHNLLAEFSPANLLPSFELKRNLGLYPLTVNIVYIGCTYIL